MTSFLVSHGRRPRADQHRAAQRPGPGAMRERARWRRQASCTRRRDRLAREPENPLENAALRPSGRSADRRSCCRQSARADRATGRRREKLNRTASTNSRLSAVRAGHRGLQRRRQHVLDRSATGRRGAHIVALGQPIARADHSTSRSFGRPQGTPSRLRNTANVLRRIQSVLASTETGSRMKGRSPRL